jgi:hypothetical protein
MELQLNLVSTTLALGALLAFEQPRCSTSSYHVPGFEELVNNYLAQQGGRECSERSFLLGLLQVELFSSLSLAACP